MFSHHRGANMSLCDSDKVFPYSQKLDGWDDWWGQNENSYFIVHPISKISVKTSRRDFIKLPQNGPSLCLSNDMSLWWGIRAIFFAIYWGWSCDFLAPPPPPRPLKGDLMFNVVIVVVVVVVNHSPVWSLRSGELLFKLAARLNRGAAKCMRESIPNI